MVVGIVLGNKVVGVFSFHAHGWMYEKIIKLMIEPKSKEIYL